MTDFFLVLLTNLHVFSLILLTLSCQKQKLLFATCTYPYNIDYFQGLRGCPARHGDLAELPQVLAQSRRCTGGTEEAQGSRGVLPGSARPRRLHGELLEAQDRIVSIIYICLYLYGRRRVLHVLQCVFFSFTFFFLQSQPTDRPTDACVLLILPCIALALSRQQQRRIT